MTEIDVEAINDNSAGIIYAVIQVRNEDLLTTMVNKPGLVFEIWLAQEPITIEDAFRDWPQGAEIFVRVRNEVWSDRTHTPPRP